MQSNNEEIIIRFSSSWWAYMIFKLGFLRAMVNGIEDALAITGRFLLLVFLMYCGAKAGLLLVEPNAVFSPWLEVGMFILQLAGLEGSIPGLARQADALRARDEQDAASKVDRVMVSARFMTVLAIAEGAAHALQLDIHLLQWASAALLVARGIVITGFLIALARIESKAPRVLSKDAHAREQQKQALSSEQARQIASLQEQLDQAQQELTTACLGKDVITSQLTLAREQAEKVDGLQAELQQALQEKDRLASQLAAVEKQARLTADLQTRTDQAHQSQAQLLSNLQNRLQVAGQERLTLTANLESANLQNADLAAKLETAHMQIADLQMQTTNPQPDLQVADAPAKKRTANNITPLDAARAKHAQGKPQKLAHADVLAFMAAHPDLKRADVASALGISERTIYNALAWQKEQEQSATSAR